MAFNSVTYLLFLAISLILYYNLPKTPRLIMLLLGSIAFYGFWRWDFVWLMLYSILLDYCCGIKIEGTESHKAKTRWLIVSMMGNLGALFYFKYLGFLCQNVQSLNLALGLNWNIRVPEIILPLGISFYTFQTMSYTIDVYRGVCKAEKNPIMFAAYVTYFPQLVAGPILRADEVIPWLRTRPSFLSGNLVQGFRRIINGLFLKVVLADNIAPLVDEGFAQSTLHLSALDCWTLAFLFGFQIYFDFAAYSQIALGSAKMMGIEFPENFHFPYFATSPREFWKRWHISLSSWIRDYLYLPLCGVKFRGGSSGGIGGEVQGSNDDRASSKKRALALILTWAIMGMWHGANWTFLYWGLYHATWLTLYRLSLPCLSGLAPWAKQFGGWSITLLLAMAAWIPFRAQNLAAAFAMHGKMLDPLQYFTMGLRENTYLVATLILLGMVATYGMKKLWESRQRSGGIAFAYDSLSWAAQLSLVFIFLRPVSQFIYFQF